MTQAPTWSVPLSGPATPTAMATRMDESLDALLSAHSGSARPAYAVAGTLWMSTATAGKHKYYFFDGTNDHLIVTIDTATGAVTYNDGVGDDPFLKKTGGTMSGAIAMGSQKVTGMANGTASGDAVNKSQLDAAENVKAWVNFNGTGTVAIRASKNVSSITDNGTGNYTVNFASALADANYAIAAAAGSDTVGLGATGQAAQAPTTTSCRILTYTVTTGSNTDAQYVNFIAVR